MKSVQLADSIFKIFTPGHLLIITSILAKLAYCFESASWDHTIKVDFKKVIYHGCPQEFSGEIM